MSKGSIRVSFAGTYDEAREYAAAHGLTAPKGLARAGDDSGLPMLCGVYRDAAHLGELRAKLRLLGWDDEFQCVVPRGSGFKGEAR